LYFDQNYTHYYYLLNFKLQINYDQVINQFKICFKKYIINFIHSFTDHIIFYDTNQSLVHLLDYFINLIFQFKNYKGYIIVNFSSFILFINLI
jgi:hypothetical protein